MSQIGHRSIRREALYRNTPSECEQNVYLKKEDRGPLQAPYAPPSFDQFVESLVCVFRAMGDRELQLSACFRG